MSDPQTYRLPSMNCPWCGYRIDSVSENPIDPHGIPPREGDGVICFACVVPSMVTKSAIGVIGLRKATQPEMDEYMLRHGELVDALHEYHQKWPNRPRPDRGPTL